ncbi:hypothetical protein NX059_003618 [Plenodomus lindquistii]|nr:hypothetical protein NX059_003618 [Plenodomus lindquistii]
MPTGGASEELNTRYDIDDIEQPPSRDECHGPHSFLSICTDPGVDWIASRIGVLNYANYATSLEKDISRRFRLRERLSKERVPEPSQETAWLYTNAYFEKSLEASFNIIDRSNFEARLRTFHQDPSDDSDMGWYALRNAVYANGCRIATFQSCTWAQAQTLSRGYLENALSVEPELIHGTPGLTAIQALLVMAFYTEGIGSAKLEYMLIGCAVRLSHARGLHLRPNSSRVTFEASQQRSWLFWTLYCVEKHLTLRSGRPSAIDDDDISCELPTWAPDAHPQFVELFSCMVKQAKYSSAIAKGLLTVKARSRSLAEKIKLVKHFDNKLTTWYANLPHAFRATVTTGSGTGSSIHGIRAEHFMHLHYCHHGNMAVVHSIFGHPWNLEAYNNPGDERQTNLALKQQVDLSDEALSHAARSMVLLTRSITITAAAPTWLVFYYPLVGLINTFISVLKQLPHPLSSTTPLSTPPRDMGTIDMAAGYFAYLDYSTEAVLNYALVHNLAQWARSAVAKATSTLTVDAERNEIDDGGDTAVPLEFGLDVGAEVNAHTHGVHNDDAGFANGDGMVGMSTCDIDGMDFTDWPAFLPRLLQVGGWG